jgi:hypothetical protein
VGTGDSLPPSKDRGSFAANQTSPEEGGDFERTRLAIAEDQLRDVIVDHYLSLSALPSDLGFTPDFRLHWQIEPEQLASSILADARCRFWISALAGHGLAFLQQGQAAEGGEPTHQPGSRASKPRVARGQPSVPRR